MGRWPCSQRPGSHHLAKACVARTGMGPKAGTPWVPISEGHTVILRKCSKECIHTAGPDGAGSVRVNWRPDAQSVSGAQVSSMNDSATQLR